MGSEFGFGLREASVSFRQKASEKSVSAAIDSRQTAIQTPALPAQLAHNAASIGPPKGAQPEPVSSNTAQANLLLNMSLLLLVPLQQRPFCPPPSLNLNLNLKFKKTPPL